MVDFKIFEKINLKGYTFLEGFPGAGLVGPMAISYIIDKLGMRYIGYVDSSEFPPLIAIHNNKPMPPVRIYADEKTKVVTILAEFAVPIDVTYDLANKLFDFIKANEISRIISIGGLPSQQQNIESGTVFAITSTEGVKKDIQKAGLKQVGEGVATGVSALMLLNAVIEGIPDIDVLVPVDPNVLDPKYAELAIITINKLIKLNVDVAELDREAKEVEEKIRELLKQHKQATDIHKKVIDEAGAPMYA